MPLLADGMKCQLAAPVRADYPAFTDADWARLLAVFPTGVCDWSKPSQGYKALEGTWLDFGATDGVDASAATIAGAGRAGDALTAQVAVDPSAELAYQWLVDGRPIDSATDATYVPTSDLVGAAVAVRITVAADGYVGRTLVSDTVKIKKAHP
jgi:hypothetical protein